MRLTNVLPALVVVLALSGCGDDGDDSSSEDSTPRTSPQADQAAAILECTTEQGLPGAIGQIEGGIPAVDLTTEEETIVVHVLGSDAEAADYQGASSLEHEAVANAVILGGAITPEHREVIKQCIEESAAG